MLIQSKRVWIGDCYVSAALLIEEGKIRAIGPYGEKTPDIDYGDKRILPGFIDIHTHGAYGTDTNDADAAGLLNWANRIPEEGVTAFLATTVTATAENLVEALHTVAKVMEKGTEGAEILGVHLEGPFLNREMRGAQPLESIITPDIQCFQEFYKASRGKIRLITLSPEEDYDFELLSYCRKQGVVVSMGHSKATYDTAMQAIVCGAQSATHTFNGMSSLHHRNPGLSAAVLDCDTLYGELIADGLHVAAPMVRLFFRCKGKDHGILITDSLRAKGTCGNERMTLGGQEIYLDTNGLLRLKNDGTIAGSTLKMNEGLRFLMNEAGIDEVSAIHAATINPATLLGIAHRKGKIAVGFDADLAVLEDDYRVCATWCRGRRIPFMPKEQTGGNRH